jgi:hypothetical protein
MRPGNEGAKTLYSGKSTKNQSSLRQAQRPVVELVETRPSWSAPAQTLVGSPIVERSEVRPPASERRKAKSEWHFLKSQY